jgi:pimeloyl-ACP methyl ester carboxylesterase
LSENGIYDASLVLKEGNCFRDQILAACTQRRAAKPVASRWPGQSSLTAKADLATAIGRCQSREAVEFLIQNVLTSVPLPDQIREQIIEDTLKGAPPAKQAWPETGMLEDITEAVSQLIVPTIVMAGENDQVERIEILERELVPNIPTARMRIIPKIGHLSPLEVPAEIAAEIRRFLSE